MGWVTRAFTPRNWVPVYARRHVTTSELREMYLWPPLVVLTLSLTAVLVFNRTVWPGWATAISAGIATFVWGTLSARAVNRRVHWRVGHERIEPR